MGKGFPKFNHDPSEINLVICFELKEIGSRKPDTSLLRASV